MPRVITDYDIKCSINKSFSQIYTCQSKRQSTLLIQFKRQFNFKSFFIRMRANILRTIDFMQIQIEKKVLRTMITCAENTKSGAFFYYFAVFFIL